ncbi:MAG: hypothetical protein HZA93_14895 [Verrucomicrobia bacterium]|nr:hypothetical protein [Verrucomicrobiota bacterium]
MTINQIAGILPAVVFPAATLVQLVRIVRQRSAAGVSVSTWLLFGFANLGIYFYAERYGEWQAIVGMLLTAVLDFVIVALAVWGYRASAASSATAAILVESRPRRLAPELRTAAVAGELEESQRSARTVSAGW